MARTVVLSCVFCLLAAIATVSRQPRSIVRPQITGSGTSDPCFLAPALFQDTGEPTFQAVPPPHSVKDRDCPFYQPAWQEFLYATKPLPKTHLPTFLSFESFQEIFATTSVHSPKNDTLPGLMLQLEPRDVERANANSAGLQKLLDASAEANSDLSGNQPTDDVVQAAVGRNVGGSLIDQHGHFVYYAIHANLEMAAFLRSNHLTAPDVASHIANAPAFSQLTALPGPSPSLAEYKSAWMIVPNQDAARDYYVTRATIPRYVVDASGKVAPLRSGSKHEIVTRPVWVALLALHVVFTLPGHPEMIWSTFEHVSVKNGQWRRDNAPAAMANPVPGTTPTIQDADDPAYKLYRANTPPDRCNTIADAAMMAAHWDAASQSFTKNGLLQTSIYRIYPGSKSGSASDEDDEVQTINANATKGFDAAVPKHDWDKRQFYRLVGAIWMDKPAHLQPGMSISNPAGMSTDDPRADVAGEDGLGSTAMESFTEAEAANCFSCHDTQKVDVAGHPPPLPQSMVNVSHLMSKYVGIIRMPSGSAPKSR
jgi:hypothetical protein